MGQQADRVFPIFMGTWIVLTALGFFLFYRNKDVTFKRKYFPWFTAFVGILFLMFLVLMEFPREAFFLMVPAITIITFLNIRGTCFCSSCGSTVFSNGLGFSRTNYCPTCGASLDRNKGN